VPSAAPAFAWLAAAASLLGGAPPDAIRAPRKIVAGSGGVCALWDAAPMRCWGGTAYTADYATRAFARPSSQPDARDVALTPSRWLADGGCVIDRRGCCRSPFLVIPRSLHLG
jgi:hypothetical protein